MKLNANTVIVSSVVVIICVVLAMTLTNSDFASPKPNPTAEAITPIDKEGNNEVEPEPTSTAAPGVGIVIIDPTKPTGSDTLNNMFADQNEQAQEAIAVRYNLLFNSMYNISGDEIKAYEGLRNAGTGDGSEAGLARINNELLIALPFLEVVDTTMLDEAQTNLAYTTLAEQAYIEYGQRSAKSPPKTAPNVTAAAVIVDGDQAIVTYTQLNFDASTQGYTRSFGLDATAKFVYVGYEWYLTFNA